VILSKRQIDILSFILFFRFTYNKNYAFYFQRVEKSEKSTVYNHLKYKKKKTSTLSYNNFYLLKGFRSSH